MTFNRTRYIVGKSLNRVSSTNLPRKKILMINFNMKIILHKLMKFRMAKAKSRVNLPGTQIISKTVASILRKLP